MTQMGSSIYPGQVLSTQLEWYWHQLHCMSAGSYQHKVISIGSHTHVQASNMGTQAKLPQLLQQQVTVH